MANPSGGLLRVFFFFFFLHCALHCFWYVKGFVWSAKAHEILAVAALTQSIFQLRYLPCVEKLFINICRRKERSVCNKMHKCKKSWDWYANNVAEMCWLVRWEREHMVKDQQKENIFVSFMFCTGFEGPVLAHIFFIYTFPQVHILHRGLNSF